MPGVAGKRPVALHRDPEAALVKRVDQRRVELEHRLAAGDHHQPALLARRPTALRHGAASCIGAGELAAALAVRADEIGVAEAALRGRAVLLAARPQIAAGKAQEHGAAAGLHALALKGQEAFLDRVGHA